MLSHHITWDVSHGILTGIPFPWTSLVIWANSPPRQAKCENRALGLEDYITDHVLFLAFFKYVLSTVGGKQGIYLQNLIGNQFHVKLRIFSPYSKFQSYLNSFSRIIRNLATPQRHINTSPPISLVEKHFLAHLMLLLNVHWKISINKCHNFHKVKPVIRWACQHQILAGEVKNSAKVKFLSSNRRDVFQYDAKLSENEDLETR